MKQEKEKLKSQYINIISKKLGIQKEEVTLDVELYEDVEEKRTILKLEFSILNQTKDFSEEIKKFIDEISVLKRFKIKPVLEALQISPDLLDPRGDKHENWCKNNIRGGERYIPPTKDWYGIGLKVKDKYENNDWLDCQNKKGEYSIAYIGINDLLNRKAKILEHISEYSDEISRIKTKKLCSLWF